MVIVIDTPKDKVKAKFISKFIFLSDKIGNLIYGEKHLPSKITHFPTNKISTKIPKNKILKSILTKILTYYKIKTKPPVVIIQFRRKPIDLPAVILASIEKEKSARRYIGATILISIVVGIVIAVAYTISYMLTWILNIMELWVFVLLFFIMGVPAIAAIAYLISSRYSID